MFWTGSFQVRWKFNFGHKYKDIFPILIYVGYWAMHYTVYHLLWQSQNKVQVFPQHQSTVNLVCCTISRWTTEVTLLSSFGNNIFLYILKILIFWVSSLCFLFYNRKFTFFNYQSWTIHSTSIRAVLCGQWKILLRILPAIKPSYFSTLLY